MPTDFDNGKFALIGILTFQRTHFWKFADRDDEEEIDVSDNEDNEGIVMKKAAENTKKRAKKSAAASRPKYV